MANVVVGSVTAELLLNTGDFKSKLKEVKTEVDAINKAFKGTSATDMAKDILKLEEQLEKNTKIIKDQAKVIDELKAGYDSATSTIEKLTGEASKLSEKTKEVTKRNEELLNSTKNIETTGKAFQTWIPTIETVVEEMNKLNNAMSKPKFVDDYIFKFATAEEKLSQLKSGSEEVNVSIKSWVGSIDDVVVQMNNLNEKMQTIRNVDYPPFTDWVAPIEEVKTEINKMNKYLSSLRNVDYGEQFIKWVDPITEVVEKINQMNEKLAKSKTEFNATTEQLRLAGQTFSAFITPLEEGFSKLVAKQRLLKDEWRTFFALYNGFMAHRPMDNFIKDMDKANAETKKFSTEFTKLHDAMMTADYNNAGKFLKRISEEATKTGEQIAKLEKELIAFEQRVGVGATGLEKFSTEFLKLHDVMYTADYSNVGAFFERMDAELRKSSEEIAIFEKRFMQMESALSKGRKFTILEDLVPANMYGELTRIQEAIAKVEAEEEKLAQKSAKAKSQMEGMSSATNKLQGAMSSLKMTVSMLSSMFIWTFGMSLWEATKQTVSSKNEMESYLNQMHMSRGSISVFNRGLDETVDKFKKLNKYMIGETIAGIGMEFDLSARQMTKAMDVVAMIQNEYVRAGRKEEEATLAVKDILQGEFLRLSRETGVGKQDLIDTGLWDGDLKNIEGLMEALRKVGTDRHWDLFAQKCTSLSDVVSTAKNRISEFTATLIDELSPIIVGAFNGLIDAVDWLTNSWNKMGGTMQMLVSGGLITGVATAVLMIGKNMGLVQIATNGFTKSLASMILKMDASTVKSQGLLRSIALTITGFESESVKGMGTVKMLTARILGLDANIIKTHNFATAIKVAKEGLVGEDAVTRANILGKQKLTTVLKESIVSWKMLKLAIMGVMALGIVAFLGMVAQSCARAKESVDTFYEVVDTGKEIVEDSQKTYDSYGKQIDAISQKMAEAGEGTATYNRLQRERQQLIRNQNQAYTNLQNNIIAQKKAEEYNAKQQERLNNINLSQQDRLTQAYINLGMEQGRATEKASKYLSEVEMGNRIINESYDSYEQSLISSTAHMEAHAQTLKNAGADAEQLERYMDDYQAESYKVAEYWKEFKQGDFWALFKIGLGELTKMWIDISNHPEVIKFMNNLKTTFQEMKPYLDAISQALKDIGQFLIIDLGNWLMSNPLGRQVAGWGALSLAIGGVGLKIASVLTGGKGMIDIFKAIADKIPSLKDKLKGLGKTAEETGVVLGGGSSKDSKGKKGKKGGMGGKYDMGGTVGGKNSPVYTDWSNTSLKESVFADAKDRARQTFKLAGYIVEAMVLVTLAIEMIRLPMWSLAHVGEDFKKTEPQIRKGIEGLKLVAPVLAILLPPIVACMVIMEKFGDSISAWGMAKAGFKVAEGIFIALMLVAEAVIMLAVPLGAIAGLGGIMGWLGEGNINQGIKAIELVGEAIGSLAPAVPIFALGVGLAISLSIPVLGEILTIGVIGGIALGIGLLAEAVILMEVPLEAIAELGKNHKDLSNVEQGAEAIKQTGIALQYLSEATKSVADIVWNEFVTQLLTAGEGMKQVVDELASDDGLIQNLNDFADKFNTLEFTPIDSGRVQAFSSLAEGIKSVSEAIKNVKDAMMTFRSEQTASQKYASATGNLSDSGFEGLQGLYDEFENMKLIIGKLSSFAKSINEMEITPVNEGIVTAITTTSNSISQVKTAVDNVKTLMGGIVDANWSSNMATGGLGSAIMGYLGGSSGTGDYTSSFGNSLQSLENSVKDIMTFNSHIQGIVGEGNGSQGGDASSTIANAVGVVQQIANVINQIKSTLSSGVGEIESTAKNLGKGIVDGIASGINENIGTLSGDLKNKGQNMGKDMAEAFKNGVNPMSTYMNAELDYVGQAFDNKHDTLVAKAGKLARDMTEAYKSNLEVGSPAKMARMTAQEMKYIDMFIEQYTPVIVGSIGQLASQMTESFAPNMTVDVGNGDALGDYKADSIMAMNLANQTVTTTEGAFTELDVNTGLTFSSIGGTIQTTMNNIATNTKTNYNNVLTTTKTQLGNMQSETTKNINAIKTSWNGMQVALIQSAENIRSETSSKINSLQNNMATFWRKVQNPALLLGGSAGSPSEQKSGARHRRFGGSKLTKVLRPTGGYAGSPSMIPTGQKSTGISDKFRNRRYKGVNILDALADYLECKDNGGDCVAGGWNFNWSSDIKRALLTWHTHFGQIYDPYLYVGKFENDTFPVRGIAPIAKNYIYDAISRTSYDYYYDHQYDPLEAWNRGAFNCYDGALLVMALADKFGFSNSHMVHGSWDGIPHVWAYIEGLGEIDATAIQGGYGLTAQKTGASANSVTTTRNNNRGRSAGHGVPVGDTTNFNGDIHIHIDGSDKDSEEIAKEVKHSILDLMSPNPSTGL